MSQYIKLKNNYRMREEGDYALIFDKSFEKILNKFQIVDLSHFGILCLCNGQFTREDLINIYCNSFNLDYSYGKKVINYIINLYKEYLDFNETSNIRNELIITRNIKLKNERKYVSKHRLISPLALSLVITYNCSCYCKYCFVNANDGKTTNYIGTDKIIELIKEAKDIGVAIVNITGGDPFTRKDIYKIISTCVNLKLDINISTKVLLSDEDIKELKKSGLNKIQISLDSEKDNETEELLSVKCYATRMLEIIKKIISNGIIVYVNTVVTDINISSIPSLINKLNELSVSKHYITPYLRTLGRHDDRLFPSYKKYESLSNYINEFKGNMIIDYKSPDIITSNDKFIEDISRCSGGRMGLVINPNGDVTICERLIDNNECIVGNINNKSILDIWNSEELKNLIEPEMGLFVNTDCHNCEYYENCVLDKGLCYARCKIAYNNIFNKDPLCPKERNNFRFI